MLQLRRYYRLTCLFAFALPAFYVRKQLHGKLRHIGMRTYIALVLTAVVMMAVAASLLVQRSVAIVSTTIITHEAASQEPSTFSVTNAWSPSHQTSTVEQPDQNRAVTAVDTLLLDIERFTRAARARSSIKVDSAEMLYQQRLARLERTTNEYIDDAKLDTERARHLRSAIKNHELIATQLISVADNRAAASRAYHDTLDAMAARVGRAVEGSWKIFGRVVARQTLVDLSTHLDQLQRLSGALDKDSPLDSAIVDKLTSADQQLLQYLQTNEKSLRRTQGDDWFNGMTKDASALAITCDALVKLIGDFQNQLRQLQDDNVNLVDRIAAEHRRQLTPLNNESSMVRLAPQAVQNTKPSALVMNIPDVTAEPSSTTTQTLRGANPWPLVWLSAGVLALLSGISMILLLGALRPIRRLLRATTIVAGGDTGVRIRRGGIKELDALAMSFNAMAEQLSRAQAANRDHQNRLELTVRERTLQLQELAERDPLTGLPNRRQLFALLDASIARARERSSLLGVLFIDVDNFKNTNDSLGHAFGDKVLAAVAERLNTAAQAIGFAARLGGDEFTVVYECAATMDNIHQAAAEIVSAFHAPLMLDGYELVINISVGVSVFPNHANDGQSLVRAADTALFQAKALGRGRLALYTPELLAAATNKFTIEQGLRRALEHNEFELVFQPEISVETLETISVEALIRWRLPDGSYESPGTFLSIAEESGLIAEIDDWVLQRAIAAAAAWYHHDWPKARVAINVSARQLLDQRFVERVVQLLQVHSLPPHVIEIELTETVLQTGTATIENLKKLRARGIAIALDDFGTGYSSLSSLDQLPLTRIKLDKSLIADLDTNPRSAAIARSIIGLCQGLGLEITAEGVERHEQFSLLVGYRNLSLQGFLLAKPVESSSIVSLITTTLPQRIQDLLLTAKPVAVDTKIVELLPVQLRTAALP